MANKTLKILEGHLATKLKQAVLDIDLGKTSRYLIFKNNGDEFYLINMIGRDSLLYSPAIDFIVFVHDLGVFQLNSDNFIYCSWNYGTYFNADRSEPFDSKYDWAMIARYVIDRI